MKKDARSTAGYQIFSRMNENSDPLGIKVLVTLPSFDRVGRYMANINYELVNNYRH